MRPSRVSLLLSLCLNLLAAPAAWPQGGPGLPLDQGLWRLNGTDPTLPYDDLEPLRRIVGGSHYVALGESIHTSGGFYEMKDRVFRFLVEQMGFRVFGMETSWFNADRVERYVQTCQGTPRDALRGVFPVWRSLETEALVQWMCEWNQEHPDDRVHFYGFDIQAQAFQDGRALLAFLQRLGIGAGDSRVEGLRVCDGVEQDWLFAGLPYPPELYERCQAALAEIAAYFDAGEKEVERLTSEEDLGWARVHLVGLQAWQVVAFYIDSDILRGIDARDRAMAYVAQAIHDLRFPHARTALWAHNGHIALRGAEAYFGTDMGTHLKAALGSQYKAIGLTARETYVDWIFISLCGFVDLPVGPGSLEHVLVSAAPGAAGVLADLTAHPPFLTPGAVYTVASVPMVPAEQFDAVIHLDVSPMMTPTSWVPCQ